MSTPAQSLFRQEVLDARSDTSSGPSIDIRPVGAGRLTFFFLCLAALVLAVLVFGHYTKKERVQGVVQPRAGVAMVVPPEAGLVKRVLVNEGQSVKAGDVIAEISNERFSDAGNTQTLLENNLEGQRQQVLSQADNQAQAQSAALAALDQRIAQGRRDLITLGEEARLQEQQIASARKLLNQLDPLLAERIISDLQYEQQRQVLLDQTARQQTLTPLTVTQLDWRPTAEADSIGMIVDHCITCERLLIEAGLMPEPRFPPVRDTRRTTTARRTSLA